MTSSGVPFGGRPLRGGSLGQPQLHAAGLQRGITNQERRLTFLNMMAVIFLVLSSLWFYIEKAKLKEERVMVVYGPGHISTIPRSKALQIVPMLSGQKQKNNANGNGKEGEETGDPSSICVLVRTFPGHGRMLQVQLSGWEAIAETIEVPSSEDAAKERDIQIILANTDARYTDTETFAFFHNILRLVVDNFNGRNVAGNERPSKVSYHMAVLPEGMTPDKSLFGFDVTQLVLDELLSNTAQHNIQCDQLIFTNGDNYYRHEILQKTGLDRAVRKSPQELSTTTKALIGFDFITHHIVKKESKLVVNQQIKAKFRHSSIDLGAAFVAADAIRNCEDANFVAFGEKETFGHNYGFKWDKNFARDWFFFESLLNCGVKTHVVHEVLFIHQ